MAEIYKYLVYRRTKGEKNDSDAIIESYSLERTIEKIIKNIERNGDDVESEKDIEKIQKELNKDGKSKNAVKASAFADEKEEDVIDVYYDIVAEPIVDTDDGVPGDPVDQIKDIIKKYNNNKINAEEAISEIGKIVE